ncbi:MAG: XdhC family protein [Ferruginibacter sp.]
MRTDTSTHVWQFIAGKFSADIAVILLYVLQSEGSSPGRQGFNMAVAADGDFFGTIGGGIMEHKFVEMARSKLQNAASGADIYKQVHDKAVAKNQSGMICSGEQTIFLYHVQAKDITHILALIDSLNNNKNGSLQLSKAGIRFSDDVPSANYYLELNGDDFLLVEKTGYKNHLYIIGGGHCALALSKLMRELDFYIHLYDEREGLNTMEQNVFAHEKTIVPSYALLNTLIPGGENVYVAIMTFGYRSDDEALRALLGKRFKYIGMLGSRTKIEKLFTEYKNENIDATALENIHSPIGIQVKSQTTTEIAISIAAEIISVKNMG